MKKWISLLFAAALLLCVNVAWTSAAAPKSTEPVPKLYLDGKELNAAVPPKLVDASVLVPIRTVAENLGYNVGWNSAKKQVTVEEGSTRILMTLNEKKAIVNGQTVSLNAPPILQSDTTLIPIRFVGETFGLQILWDNTAKAAFLYTDASASPAGSGGRGDPGETSGNAGDEDQSPEKPPADGSLIGVVEEPGDSTDGTGDPAASDPASGDPAAQEPVPDVAQAAPALVKQIRYEPGAVTITYEGALTATSHVLSGPDRIVVDLAAAGFADVFSAGTSNGVTPAYTPVVEAAPATGEIKVMPITVDEAITGVRFSRYSVNPDTVRVVLDLKQYWNYQVTNNSDLGEIRIQLQKTSVSVPAKNGYIVVLDAGHGGSDPGAKSITGKWEKEFNLSVVKKVQGILSKEGKIHLVLTREGDTYPTLDDRIHLANSLQADLFVSVHGNSNNKQEINGTETYYNREDSRAFAGLLHRNAVAATGFKDNGVRTANFKVIKYTTMPAVLLEVGYLSNAANEKAMYSDAFQNRVAQAIAASIKQYFNLS